MSEAGKTVSFIVVGVAAVCLALITRPSAPTKNANDQRGKALVEDFDPLSAASLEIWEFDEDTATVKPFTVAKTEVKGKPVWTIPSHENYPADAKDQMAAVASGLIGLKILDEVSKEPGDYSMYGVVDPGAKDLKVGAKGVGTRVLMKDSGGKPLVSLIIGKSVPDRPELHYVRRIDGDVVCVVDVKTDQLTTKFDKWIEKDLLKISTWDLKQLAMRDYSVDQLNMALIQRGETNVEYNDTGDPHWKILKDQSFEEGKWTPVKLADDEELNTSKLDDLKNALGDLKIVDVARKPEGLSADLKAQADFAKNREAALSLATRGFFIAKVGKEVELFSNEGEIRPLMKDGVEYVLRFGAVTGQTSEDKKDEKSTDSGENKDAKASPGMNRYLLVTAEFNPDLIPKPQFEKEPEADAKKTEAKPDEKKSDEKKDDAKTADEQKPEGSAEAKPTDEAKDAKKDPADPKAEEEAETKDKTEAKSEEKKDDQAQAAEIERVRKENKRKQDEYDEKIKKGKDRVKELNDRFADWYYVISDDVYRKVHLGHDELVRKKEKKDEKKADETKAEGEKPAEGSLENLDQLKKKGLGD